jgi:hypothetical protein
MEKGRSGSDAEEKSKEGEKRLTHRQAIDELSKLIGATVSVLDADSLRKQLAVVADQESEIAPEMQAAIEEFKKRSKEHSKPTAPPPAPAK